VLSLRLARGLATVGGEDLTGDERRLVGYRASVCEDYFVTHLTLEARQSVATHAEGKGVDPALVRAVGRLGGQRELILARLRMTAIMRPKQAPIVRPRKPIPPKDCEEAKARGRAVLTSWATLFTDEERRRLAHLCRSATVRDGYLNSMDPEFQKIVFGIGGQMTEAEAEAFANRFRACTDLMHPFSTGPNADDLDVVGALRGLHSRIEQAIDQMVVAAALEETTFSNRRRAALQAFVTREMQNPMSLYFKWL